MMSSWSRWKSGELHSLTLCSGYRRQRRHLSEFDEFVAICGSFCMWSQHEILQFCFQTFDADGGGTIDEEEFKPWQRQSHTRTISGNFARHSKNLTRDGDGLIDFGEFVTMNRRYPMVLFPMFRLQDKMQSAARSEALEPNYEAAE